MSAGEIEDEIDEEIDEEREEAAVGGKKSGAKGWTPEENIHLINAATELGLTSYEGEKDPKWSDLSRRLQIKTGDTCRGAVGIQTHFKQLIQHTRINAYFLCCCC